MLLSRKFLIKCLPELKNISFEEFNYACVNLGMEIEQVINHPKLTNLVVGKIIDRKKIENSKHLKQTTVLINEQENVTKTIVCGADNIKKGQLVVVALPGCQLPNGIIINERELMGVKSQGMLCGYKELTPFNHACCSEIDANGIIELDKIATVGDTNIQELLGLDDTIYDLSLPTNRTDYTGSLYVINDLAKFFNCKFNLQYGVKTFSKLNEEFNDFLLVAKVDKFKNKEASWDLKGNLINAGIKCQNKFKDIISYISSLTGVYPLIIDAEHVQSFKRVRINAEVKINNQYIKLNDATCLINQNNEIIAIDNLFVFDQFNVSEKTKSAWIILSPIDAINLRTISQKLNINSFESKNNTKFVSQHQINMFLLKLNSYIKFKTNSYKIEKIKTKEIKFNLESAQKFIGLDDAEIIKNIFKQWKYKLVSYKDLVFVPNYRSDLNNECDLYEEILKLYTFDKLDTKPITDVMFNPQQDVDEYSFIKKLFNLLTNKYINQVKTYNLTTKKDAERLNLFNLKPKYQINPCSNANREYMRTTLIYDLLKVLQFNLNRKNDLLPVFELQKIYNDDIFWNLTIIAPEKLLIDAINNVSCNFNTFGLKDLAVEIANLSNQEISFKKANTNLLYKNDSLEIFFENQSIGFIGSISRNILKEFKLENTNLYLLDINLKNIVNYNHKTGLVMEPINERSYIHKDITFNCSENTDLSSIIKQIKSLDYLKELSFIKAYKLDNSNIAYTIRLLIKNENDSLINKEKIDQYIDQINQIIKNNLN
ncbi:phenylalanyl-tRNA synthetase beta chain [Candidatus Malacoplasma girerdii]|uniref:phenylalanine--tRNA ligase n=1 Tax=Candidatus Malacoplasma girerdii TaxID=1318617 RepID=A0A097SS83_9BACT|nr:phenylalanyl-tRNA synthetase beta chain [Candidatus Malacoplasma girerdii]